MPHFYGVRNGTVPGIYTNWSDCELQIKHYSGAEYKSFTSYEEAEIYMQTRRGPNLISSFFKPDPSPQPPPRRQSILHSKFDCDGDPIQPHIEPLKPVTKSINLDKYRCCVGAIAGGGDVATPINTPTASTPVFTTEQQSVIDGVMRGDNIFMTGPGGTGKSMLIRHIKSQAEKQGKRVQVCAMTGCAAVLLECGARTLNSWAGVGLAKGDQDIIVTSVCHNKYKKAAWTKTDLLIVDEVSMMSRKMFDTLDLIGQFARKRMDVPFGGMQLVFSGDFFQLPPVGNSNDPGTEEFCFESVAWSSAFAANIELTKLFRQRDAVYGKILNEIREGRLTKSSHRALLECVGRHEGRDSAEGDPKVRDNDIMTIPTLFPTRRKVESMNCTKFAELECTDRKDSIKYDLGVVPIEEIPNLSDKQVDTYNKYSTAQKKFELDYMKKNTMMCEELELKIGTQVMCIANISTDGPNPIVNGSQGIVMRFMGGFPVVKFRGGFESVVKQHVQISDVLSGIAISQIPLVHAWAISIHKSQGTTLEAAKIDIGSSVFECGQTYVALSRVRDLSGLYLTEFNPQKIKVSKKVKKFYSDLRATDT